MFKVEVAAPFMLNSKGCCVIFLSNKILKMNSFHSSTSYKSKKLSFLKKQLIYTKEFSNEKSN